MTTGLRAHARMAVPTGYKSLHMLAAATSVNMQNVRQFFVQRQDVDEAEWEALQQRDRQRTEAIISRAKTDVDHSVKERCRHELALNAARTLQAALDAVVDDTADADHFVD